MHAACMRASRSAKGVANVECRTPVEEGSRRRKSFSRATVAVEYMTASRRFCRLLSLCGHRSRCFSRDDDCASCFKIADYSITNTQAKSCKHTRCEVCICSRLSIHDVNAIREWNRISAVITPSSTCRSVFAKAIIIRHAINTSVSRI